MIATILNYVLFNLLVGSYVTGWVFTNDFVTLGDTCVINPSTRIRFSSKYCSESSLVDILDDTGVSTLPTLVHWLVLTSIISAGLGLCTKISFGSQKPVIVFFDAVCATCAFGAMTLYLNLIDSQLIFTDDNSIKEHTGFQFILTSFVFAFVVLMMSLVKLKRKNDNQLLWLN